jgi:hypothetical protein
MNRKLVISAASIVASTIFLSASAKAFDMSIGGNVWYSWWLPSWVKNITAKGTVDPRFGRIYTDKPDYEMDANFLYGPMVSTNIRDMISIGSVFMYGHYRASSEGDYINPQNNYSGWRYRYIKANRTIKKYDSDTTVAYHLNTFMKIFTGFKFQGYEYKYYARWVINPYSTQPANRGITKAYGESRVSSFGPGLGIGFNMRLIQNFFLQANLSGLILWGIETADFDPAFSMFTDFNVTPLRFKKGIFYSYGGNANIAFAYYIDPIDTTVRVGFRYQVLRYEQKNYNRGFSGVDNQFDHFFGFTCTILYTIQFKKKKGPEEPLEVGE